MPHIFFNRNAARARPLWLIAGFLFLLALQTAPPRWTALAFSTWLDARQLTYALERDATRLPAAARALVWDVRAWRAEFAPFVPYVAQWDWLPIVGGDVKSAPQFLRALDAALDAAEPSLALYEKLAPALKTQTAGAALVAFSQNNAAELGRARAAVQNARLKFDAVDARVISPFAYARLETMRRALDEWDAALRLLERAPIWLGAAAPKRYLLLAQNNDELRPTGGFITAVGVFYVDAGKIQSEWFGDSLSADDLNLIHPPPPAPLQKYMWASQWLLRDVNWYADFPASARAAQAMYARDHGVRVDGVIAVDLRFMPLLVQAVNDLQLDGVTLTRDNIIGAIKASWRPLPQSDYMSAEWFANERKNFLGALMRAMLTRIQNGDANAAALAQALWRGLRGKAVQAYLDDADAQQALEAAGWGGALQTGPADYLNVIDANVGFNKVNARVTREIFYTVRLNEQGGDATVELTYRNPSRPADDACDLLRQHKDTTYASMEHSCYWNYVRVLTPRFTQFVSAQGARDAGYAEEVDAVTALGGYMLVERNAEARVQFRYALPNTILQDNAYALQLQTQAGTAATPVRVRVIYPAAWRVVNATDAFQRVDATTIEFQLTLTRDKRLKIYFDK